jgi:hypothetical protein
VYIQMLYNMQLMKASWHKVPTAAKDVRNRHYHTS